MGLYIRMAIYFIAPFIAGLGFASYNPDAGTLTVNLDDLAVVLGGIATFIGTFWAGRVAKARGGKT
jgi:hypothetical protein